jgi:hypothetical protein
MYLSQAQVLHRVLKGSDTKCKAFRLVGECFEETVLQTQLFKLPPFHAQKMLTRFSCLYSLIMNVSILLAVTLGTV